MEHESFEDAATAAADERALRQRQGRPRGASRRRRRLHGRDGRDDRAGRLADDRLPHARRTSRSTRGTYFPPEPRHGHARASGSCSPRSPRPGASAATTSATGAAARRRARRDGARRAVARAARPRRSSPTRSGRIAATFEPAPRRLRARAEVPAPPRRSSCSCGAGGDEALAHGAATLDGMAAGRHLRPRRRRLPPLLRRRPLARAALREDALRQRAARLDVPARVGGHRRRRATARSSRRRSTTCCASCASGRRASRRPRTPTPTASRGSPTRGRAAEAAAPGSTARC